MKHIPIYRVTLVRDASQAASSRIIQSPADAYEILRIVSIINISSLVLPSPNFQ